MGVQALDPVSRAAHAPAGSRADATLGDHGVAGLGVASVGGLEQGGIDVALSGADTPGRLDARDRVAQLGVDQPVAGGHGSAVVEERRVLDHDRGAVAVADDHGECPGRFTSQATPDLVAVGLVPAPGGRGLVTAGTALATVAGLATARRGGGQRRRPQRQNSRVWSTRDRYGPLGGAAPGLERDELDSPPAALPPEPPPDDVGPVTGTEPAPRSSCDVRDPGATGGPSNGTWPDNAASDGEEPGAGRTL
jgi:hypothetical protein